MKRGGKTGGPKRSPEERENDLATITKWRLEGGLSQAAIAAQLRELRPYTLSQKTISADLEEVRKRWSRASVENMNELKMRELDKIDHLEEQAWQRYYESIGPDTRSEIKKSEGGTHETKDTKLIKVVLRGDPRWFTIIIQCWQRRAKLLGLDAPESYLLSAGTSNAGLTVQIVRATLEDAKLDGDE